MAGERKHTIEVSERELRAILWAFDMARDQTVNGAWMWWHKTRYVNNLYGRLLNQGLVSRD